MAQEQSLLQADYNMTNKIIFINNGLDLIDKKYF